MAPLFAFIVQYGGGCSDGPVILSALVSKGGIEEDQQGGLCSLDIGWSGVQSGGDSAIPVRGIRWGAW